MGLVDIFDRCAFLESLNVCYTNPLGIDPTFLCHLYLVFAIGLVLATPEADSQEEAIINALRAADYDQAECFYRNAKNLADPEFGFEDADFWSVQALLLMAIYMLAVSKRNAAYAYYGKNNAWARLLRSY